MLLHEKLKGYQLLLGSQSPRRKELMSMTDIPFTVVDIRADESYPSDMPHNEVPLYLARLKSESFKTMLSEKQILITADTLVLLNDSIISKPTDRDDAIRKLKRLSGKVHTVTTGVVLRKPDHMLGFSASSLVWFRRLTTEEIEYYVDAYRPFDKAGSYGIQEWMGCVGIKRIDGSHYNVMGLPTEQLYVNLNKFVTK